MLIQTVYRANSASERQVGDMPLNSLASGSSVTRPPSFFRIVSNQCIVKMDDRVSLEEKLELLGWVARCDGLEAVAASWRHQAALLYSLTGVCVCVCVCGCEFVCVSASLSLL